RDDSASAPMAASDERTAVIGPAAAPASAPSGSGIDDNLLARAKTALSSMFAALESARSFLTSAWAGDASRTAQDTVADLPNDQDTAALLDGAGQRKTVALLNRFLERLSIESEDKSRLIEISFTSEDPKKAALIANKLVEEYMESQLETKSEGARRAAEWLEVRLAELGDTVRSLEQRVQEQRAQSGSDADNIVSQRLAELTTQLVSAQPAVAAAGARYKRVRSVLDGHGNRDALPAVIASSVIQGLRSKHTDLSARLAELQTIYGENHPQIVATRAEIARVEERLR